VFLAVGFEAAAAIADDDDPLLMAMALDRDFCPNFAEGELLGGVLSKNIHVSNENMRGNLCCA
jgi:hypothetical protein